MAIYNKRLELTKEKLIEHYLKRDTLPDFIYGIVRFIGIIVQNIYCVSSYLVLSWIILFPISWIRSDLYSKAENYLYNSLLFIVSSWSLAAGANIVETGDEYKHLIEEPEIHASSDKQNAVKRINGYNQAKGVNLSQARGLKPSSNDDRYNLDTSDKSSGLNEGIRLSGDQRTNNEPENDLNQRNDNIIASRTYQNNNNIENNFKIKSVASLTNLSYLQVTNSSFSSSAEHPTILKARKSFMQSQRKPRVLMLCNHISTADVPLLMQSFSTLTNQSLLWVLDAQVSFESKPFHWRHLAVKTLFTNYFLISFTHSSNLQTLG